jgi:hypothetical protein
VATLNAFPSTRARAAAAIVKLAPDGSINVLNRSAGTVDFLLDLAGYFE